MIADALIFFKKLTSLEFEKKALSILFILNNTLNHCSQKIYLMNLLKVSTNIKNKKMHYAKKI